MEEVRLEELVSPSRERASLADEAFMLIGQGIVQGKLAHGTKLNIDALARALGMSATPIREALARLERDGLCVREAWRSYTVAHLLDASQRKQYHDYRVLLESEAVRLATRALQAGDPRTDGLLDELQGDIDALRRALQDPSRVTTADLGDDDKHFHERIARASGNEFLSSAILRLDLIVSFHRHLVPREVVEELCPDHCDIVEAMRSGDEEAAVAAIVRHLNGAYQAIESVIPLDSK